MSSELRSHKTTSGDLPPLAEGISTPRRLWRQLAWGHDLPETASMPCGLLVWQPSLVPVGHVVVGCWPPFLHWSLHITLTPLGSVLPTLLCLFGSQCHNCLRRSRPCGGFEEHRSESGYEVSLVHQSFIPTGVHVGGLWNCLQGPSECFRPKEEARSLVCPEVERTLRPESRQTPLGSCSCPVAQGRAGQERKALRSPTRGDQQGS